MAREDISDKCWEAAQKRANNTDTWVTDISAGSYFDSKGRAFGSSSGYVCHAFMTYKGPPNNEPFVFVNDTKKSKYGSCEKLVEKFFTYICQESPLRNFVLNNDNLKQMINGGVIIDCKAAGSNATLWLCKTLRYAVEDPSRVKHWSDLVDAGVHPMLALCVASCVNSQLYDQGTSTHCSTFIPPATKEDMKRLFVDHLPNATSWETEYFKGFVTANVFGTAPGGYGYRWDKHLLPISKYGRATEKVPDGWGGYTLKPVVASIKKLAKDLIELQKEYVK
jgi:hypothetical protein